MTAAAMRVPQGFLGTPLPSPHAVEGGGSRPESKKRPLARQRPKSREETPKEGGGNADALPHEGYLASGRPKCKRQIIDC